MSTEILWSHKDTKIIRNWAFGFGRIQKLNEVGFSWDGKEALRLEQYDPQWSERFDELLRYAAMHLFLTNTKRIRNWDFVHTQRQQYKNNQLSPEHAYKLNVIGFVCLGSF